MFIIRNYSDEYNENYINYEEFIINTSNSFTWESYGPHMMYGDNTAEYEFYIRVGEENKLLSRLQTTMLLSFESKDDNTDKKTINENKLIVTEFGNIDAEFEIVYFFGAWY